MSNNKIREICNQITVLENELHTALEGQNGRPSYQLKGKHVIFEKKIKDVHQIRAELAKEAGQADNRQSDSSQNKNDTSK